MKLKTVPCPAPLEVLERGFEAFRRDRQETPYQEERRQMISPFLAGWFFLAMLHWIWPLGIILGLGLVAVAVWRVRVGCR